MKHLRKSVAFLVLVTLIVGNWAPPLPVKAAADIAYTSFEEPAAVPGVMYTDTGDSLIDHALLNNAGEPPVNYISVGGELGFTSAYINTRNDVGLTDGDYVGVTDYYTTVVAFPDGVHGFEMSDTDGAMHTTFDTVDLSAYSNASLSIDYFVQNDGWETLPADVIRIWVVVDGAVEIDLLNTTGSDIDDLGIEGAWRTATQSLAGYTEATLHVLLDSNAGAEAIYIDSIVFSGDPPICSSDLFISEYIEGSSYNKALELYNGSGAAVDLLAQNYNIDMYFNGATIPGLTVTLTGTVAAGDVYVIAQTSATTTILLQADQLSPAAWYNGDDAVVLRRGDTIVDVIGQIGVDPGTEWGTDLTSTADNTLRRKVEIAGGDPNGSDDFDPALEWDGHAINTFDGLGSHSPICVPPPDSAPTVSGTSPGSNAIGVATDANLSVTFNEAVSVTGNWLQIACSISGTRIVTDTSVSGGPLVWTVDPVTDFSTGETCTATIYAAQVTDQDGVPQAMEADYAWSFATVAVCGDPFTHIYEIQGSGLASPLDGTQVSVEGVVVGDFQNNTQVDDGNLGGFYIQEFPGDGDPATSDGLYIYGTTTDVVVGDLVRLRGTVDEYNGMTELVTIAELLPCSSGNLITPTQVSLPVLGPTDFEPVESMLVTFPQDLVISEYFNFDRYGEIFLTSARQMQPTAIYEPGSPEQAQLAADNVLGRITLDDGRTNQNPDPAIHPNGEVFTMTNLFRGGDTVANVTGVLEYRYNLYRIQPTEGADYAPANPRPPQPVDVGGDIKVASFNVYNYFTTIDTGAWICGPSHDMECRGADTPEELARQRAKLVAALVGIDADIVGLIEIENGAGDVPVADLAAGLNETLGAGTYDYLATGDLGTDAIRVALIYRPGAVTPVGNFALLNSTVDPTFLDTYNRPVLAQTFRDNASGGLFTVAVNHLKSKGSDCNLVGDPDLGDGAGNCNLTRKAAVQAEVAWLATDPTASGDPDFLVIGDLNSYDKEDPIDVLTAAGYVDLLHAFQGEYAYSYVYDGQIGYLDYQLANASLASQVAGAASWHINADEPDLVDYDMTFKLPAQDAIYAPDAYRSSDHDAVIAGLDFGAAQISLIKTATPTIVTPNEVLTYTLKLSNTGELSDTVTLTDALPEEVTFAGWVEQPAGAAYDSGEITWTGTLDVGQTVTLAFGVTNTAVQGTVSNTAYFAGTQQTGSATAVYHASGSKLWIPLIVRNYAPQ